MWDFSGRKGAALGIDIGTGAVRLLQLRRERRGYRVERCAMRPLLVGAVREQRIVDSAAVGAALHEMMPARPCTARRAVVAVPGSAVITRQLQLEAALHDADLELRVALEAERHIPFAPGEIALDFARLDSSDPSSPIVLAACRREHVDERVAALRDGGIEPAVVEVATQAVERAFAVLGNTSGLVALADFGCGFFTLYVLRDGVVIHQREQAANVKPIVLEQAFLERMEQLGRALQVFYSSSTYQRVDRLVLVGGGAVQAGFAALVETTQQVPVTLGNPLAVMTWSTQVDAVDLAREGAAWFLAAGLALRGLNHD